MGVKAPKESDLVKAVQQLLVTRGCFCWRQNAGAFAAPATATTARRFVRFVSAEADGISDVVGMLPDGVFLAVEVKKPGGRTEKTRAARQAAFRARVAAKGGLALVVSSLDQLDAALRAEGY